MRMPFVLIAAASVLAVSAGTEGRAQSAGQTVGRSYPVGGFTALEVAGPFDVRVATGRAVSVSARGPQALLDGTEVVVRDGKLLIRAKRKGWLKGMNWGSKQAAVFTVTVPAIEAAAISGSGEVAVDRVVGERFRGAVAGSGIMRVGSVAVKELGLAIAGSGEIGAAGQAQRASYRIAGSGDVDASRLRSVDADASISGSGMIKAQATGTARASINGSGDIAITGGARCQTSRNGSGDIRCS